MIGGRSLEVLEFPSVIERLKGWAGSELGRKAAEGVSPLDDPAEIELHLEETLQMKEFLEGGGELPVGGLRDIGGLLKRLEAEGAFLDGKELLEVAASIAASDLLKKALKEAGGRLKELGRRFHAPVEVANRILAAIDPRGEVRDEASPHLSSIRRRMREVHGLIYERIRALLGQRDWKEIVQDEVITQRNDRFVVLVKADGRARVKGIVHDVSQSRASLYIEPFEVVELNNELGVLRRGEREEEERVLRALSREVAEVRDRLSEDLSLQAEVDLLYAKAKLAIELGAQKPALNEEGITRMLSARHPLLVLSGEEVVPIDLLLDPQQRILVISGANAGGKTVALKTLGLLTLMVKAGLLIPASASSTVNLFGRLFAYIGDEQDLEGHLSTFSSFINWVKGVLEEVGPSTLILIDEIGTGTDHSQGAALAMALLDEIRKKGGYAVVTTHLDLLKAYAYGRPEVCNVAVEFDPQTLTPTFRLLYGRVGQSWAFPIAERWGLKKELIERAKEYHRQRSSREAELLEELTRLQGELEAERKALASEREKVSQRRERLERAVRRLREKREEILRRVEERGRRVLAEAEERLKEILREAPSFQRPFHLKGELKRVREDLRKVLPSKRVPKGKPEEVKEGDWVEVLGLGKEGMVTKILSGRVEVMIEGIRAKVPLEEVRVRQPVRQEGEGKGIFAWVTPPARADRKINVVGLRVEDALPKVEKLIDQALLYGWEKVEIVHGIGTGRLREAIKRHLEQLPWVKELRPAPVGKGGVGVTVVELK